MTFVAAICLVSCSSESNPADQPDCTTNSVPGLEIKVKGGGVPPQSADEAPALGGSHAGGAGGGEGSSDECVAVVALKDGDYSTPPECFPAEDPADCICYGARERAGDYIVTATVGPQSQSQYAKVTNEDECHVKTTQVTFKF